MKNDLDHEITSGRVRVPDFSTAFVLRVFVPDHGQDEQGHWLYGVRPSMDFASNPEIVAVFASEMRAIVTSSAELLVGAGTLREEEVERYAIVRR